MSSTLGVVEIPPADSAQGRDSLLTRRFADKPHLEWVIRRATESLLIDRSLVLAGPVEIADIRGRIEVRGSGVDVDLLNLFVNSGCEPGSLTVTEGARAMTDVVEVRVTTGTPCPPAGLTFGDDFETGNTDAWSVTIP